MYQVHLKVISPQDCARKFSDDAYELGKHEICAQAHDKSTCEGDSGGPLINNGTGRQVGIVSYGRGDCTRDAPSVFSSVQDNLDFINQVMMASRNN